MKKLIICLLSFLLLFTPNVYAKDSVYSLNEHEDEEFFHLLRGYNEEGTVSGFVAAGHFTKKVQEEDKEYDDIQVMLVKYKKNGTVLWNYQYGKSGEDSLYDFVYSYDEEHHVNGYLLFVQETYEKEEEKPNRYMILFVDLEGKLVSEAPCNLDNVSMIRQVIELKDEDDQPNSYLIIGKKSHNVSFMAKYDLSFNLLWNKEYTDYTDFQEVCVNKSSIVVLTEKEKAYTLLRMNLDGDILSTIKDDFEEKDHPHILSIDDHFILYGFTSEVKVTQEDGVSYYLVEYNENNEIEWETVGDVSLNQEQIIQLKPITKNDELLEYQLLYVNGDDNSIEIVRIGLDGVVYNKVKKIRNNYYHINSFLPNGNTIYFVGQINCPDDDNCDFDENSLFLVSSEDKVIEVKEKDSNTILIVIAGIFVFIFLIVFLRRRKK
ncbi:MAG: hypothetical protein IJG68_02820 [Bacilli bacterium]|nr:hypothetical protein [Bacilli bacterium]